MKKNLTRIKNELYFYKDGVKKIVDYNDKLTYPDNIKGDINSELRGDISELWGNINSGLRGDISGLGGDISELRGDISGLWGYISELRGDINSGLRGDISGLRGLATDIEGNIDACHISEEERTAGIDIKDLIK